MGIDRALLLGLVLALLVFVDFSWAGSEVDVKGNPVPNLKSANNSNEKPIESKLGSDPVTDDKQKEKKTEEGKVGAVDQVSKPKDAAVSNDGQRNDSKTGNKEADNGKKGNADLDVQLQSKTVDGNQKEGKDGEKEPKLDVDTKDGKNGVPADPLPKTGKEISRGEECDHSNKCVIEDSKLVACIRVPGNESPDLSLLIQNNGNVPVSVTILSPDFVHLETKNIQLQQKENKKVKVSIADRGSDSSIVLKTATGSCSLDIRDVIDHYLGEDSDNSLGGSTQAISRSRTHLLYLLACFVVVPVLVGSGWLCFILWRKKFSNGTGGSSKYQRLEMALPVSGGVGKTAQPEANEDGWDNSWGDDWGDDEEMPKTPSMPLTPSVSGKGLASRRLNKDGWKD
ncbi:unnamed protein product [Linum tenue]|uniref:DUF7356 domain-containing protein n=1 Tax=Linum tenue TaxID=586396 RepID=A0AAV0M449_9ROSI|nr:unnamed protein product [Linum tenue]